MQTLYKRVCEYMELDDRVEVLNNRFQVLPRTSCPPAASYAGSVSASRSAACSACQPAGLGRNELLQVIYVLLGASVPLVCIGQDSAL